MLVVDDDLFLFKQQQGIIQNPKSKIQMYFFSPKSERWKNPARPAEGISILFKISYR